MNPFGGRAFAGILRIAAGPMRLLDRFDDLVEVWEPFFDEDQPTNPATRSAPPWRP